MSFTEYTSRMNKVLDYIDANLDQPLHLEAIADIAHFRADNVGRLQTIATNASIVLLAEFNTAARGHQISQPIY